MTSITWVISLFVVLFVTCCPAVPIGKQYDVSTSDYKFTTDKPIFGRELPINMELAADEESTVTPHFNEKRKSHEHDSDEDTTSNASFTTSAYEHDSNEYTTPSQFKKHDDEFHHKRRFGDASFTTPTTDFVSEEPHDLHSFNNHVFNNLESSTEFNERATRYREAELEENLKPRAQRENEFETTTDFEFSSFEPESHTFESSSSSVDSFGKSTGFVHENEFEEKPTTPEFQPTTPQ